MRNMGPYLFFSSQMCHIGNLDMPAVAILDWISVWDYGRGCPSDSLRIALNGRQ